MDTIPTREDIDKDVESLHRELDRHDGKWNFHLSRRGKYIAIVVVLAFFAFLFGILTKPVQEKVLVSIVPAELDPYASPVVQPDLDARLLSLHDRAKTGNALVPLELTSGDQPRILTWTPDAIGRIDANGQVLPVSGTYELPSGWFGAIRLVSDGKEIGSVGVDARNNASTSRGSFLIVPQREEGQHLVRLVFDAVDDCRIACAPGDKLCMKTNVNYCVGGLSNQEFLSYAPVTAEARLVAGSCTTKTFVAGPKYAPQIPEDYTMCEKGMWNTDLFSNATKWASTQPPLDQKSLSALASALLSFYKKLPPGSGGETLPDGSIVKAGSSGEMNWKLKYTKGDADAKRACNAIVEVSLRCEDGQR